VDLTRVTHTHRVPHQIIPRARPTVTGSLPRVCMHPHPQVEDCLDLTRIPSPASFGARRRMGRRFDESLIVEVEVLP
jgi:hypothetical protein